MANFTIDSSNKVLRTASGNGTFNGEAELCKLASDWPMARLAAVWNNLPGVAPLTRFKDRETAIQRIWKAVQDAKLSDDTSDKGGMRKVVRAKQLDSVSNQAGKGTKTEQIIALLKAPSGASMKSIIAATGWQAHSVRGFVSAQLIKRMGLRVKSIKRAGERIYLIQR